MPAAIAAPGTADRHPDRHRARLHLLPPHPRPRPRLPRRAGGPARRRAAAHDASARSCAACSCGCATTRPRSPCSAATTCSRTATHTARLVREFVAALPAAEHDDLLPWLDAAVTFPNAMVDRIVPATTDADRAAVARHLGVDRPDPGARRTIHHVGAAGPVRRRPPGVGTRRRRLHRRRPPVRAAQTPPAQRNPFADRLSRRPGRPRHHPGRDRAALRRRRRPPRAVRRLPALGHRAGRRRPRRLRGPALHALVQHRARAPHPAGRLRRLGQTRPARARTGPPAPAGGPDAPPPRPDRGRLPVLPGPARPGSTPARTPRR